MDINTRHLRYLVGVADEGSFSRAADRLAVSQPALSRRIQALEDELGVSLFDRTPRHTKLTPAGQQLIDHFREVIESAAEVSAVVAAIERDRSPILRIGAAVYADQPERSRLLAAFEASYPAIRIQTETAPTSALMKGLQSGTFDVLVIVAPIPDERLEYVVLRWFPVQVILPAASTLARAEELSLDSFAGSSIVSFERKRQPRLFDKVIAPLEAAGAKIDYPDDQSIRGLLSYASDHGSAVISSMDDYSVDDLRAANMIGRPLNCFAPVVALLLMRIAHDRPAQFDRFWEFAKSWVGRDRGDPAGTLSGVNYRPMP